MNKHALIAILAFLPLALPLSATTVQFSAAGASTSRQAVLADGSTLVSTGSDLVMLGTFSNVNNFAFNSALSVQQNFTNMLAVGDGGFSQFGLSQPGNGSAEWSSYTLTLSTTGVLPHSQVINGISDESTPQSGVNASFFDGKQIYIVIVNGATVGAASQMGIYTSTAWLFPTNTGNSLTDTSSFATSSGTTVSATGGAGQATSSQLQLAAAGVPEPTTVTTILVGACGLLGLLRRRRIS